MAEDDSIHYAEYKICGLTKKELTSCGRALDNTCHSDDCKKITCHLCIDILKNKNDDLGIKDNLGA